MSTDIQWENIPSELKALPHWVVWKYETRDKGPTKVPYNARTNGGAMSNNASTWTTFEAAKKRFERGGFDGVGFMLGAGKNKSGFVGVDLDHCFDSSSGTIESWAHDIVEPLQTYTEITPSGEGLRCFGTGFLPPSGRKKGHFECYDSVRFLTVTGNVLFPDRGIEEITEPLASVHKTIFGEKEEAAPTPPPPSGGATLDDKTLLDKMFASKTGDKARSLYQGDFKGAGYSSQSEADSSFCFMLAFWTGRDDSAMDRIFRTSGLMREKWDKRHGADGQTYGQLTIDRAVDKVRDTYDPPQSGPRVVLRGRQARAYVDGATEEEAAKVEPDPDETDPEDWRTGPYGISDGRIVHIWEKTVRGELTTTVQTVANFTCKIAREIVTEHGDRVFVLKGVGGRGRKFEMEVSAQILGDEKLLKIAFIKAAGAKSPVAAGMSKHLAPAIDCITGHIEQSVRWDRTGWADTENGPRFLLPGRENKLPPYSSINLQGGVAYGVREGGDIEKGIQALRFLLKSQSTPLVCVALAAMLQGPLNLPAGWRNERYGTFVTGRSNSFKTSTTQVLMCLYGADFIDNRNLLRWDGTTNGMMGMAVLADDLPLLIDNYKPQVGKDAAAKCIGFIQSVVEGGEKVRMTQEAKLRDRSAINCMPFVTGEDVPDTDVASLARVIVLRYPEHSPNNPELTKAQQLSHHLCAVGDAWLSWLESEDGQQIAKNRGGLFLDRRGLWSESLRGLRNDMQGVPRIATSLSINELTWDIMSHCPVFRELARDFAADHERGLKQVAGEMSIQTADALEAHRYLDALRQLLGTKRFILAERLGKEVEAYDRDRLLGWRDNDGVYLLPDLAYRAACDLLRDSGGLNNMSKNTLHKQLDSIGALVNKGAGGATVPKKCNSNLQRVLHLPADIFGVEGVTEDE